MIKLNKLFIMTNQDVHCTRLENKTPHYLWSCQVDDFTICYIGDGISCIEKRGL